MALYNNTPANTYIYIENLTITYNNQTYPITSLYTNKKYIYFDLNSPQTLYLSDIRKKDENLIYIIKNINGNGIIINNELIRLVFDNFDPQGLVKKVEEVVDVSERYKLELDSMSEDVETLSDKYKKDKSFNDIKESLNTSIIEYNSLLINASTLLTNFLSDSVSTSSLMESNSSLYLSDTSTTSSTFLINPSGSKLSNTNLINSLLMIIPFPFMFLIM